MNGYPDYEKVVQLRIKRIKRLSDDVDLLDSAKVYYKDNPVDYIKHWGITYDPRNAGTLVPTLMPFIPFKRQLEFIEFLYQCWRSQEHGSAEKCRDVGATWIACNFSDWLWRFHDGSAVGWGSRKEQLVDKMGDPDSIFEKIRMVQANIPSFFQPEGWNPQRHSTYMKIINPENGSTITGEAGDNIGRGGRKTIYFKDESAHYEHPEKIEAALGDNTNIQIDISSVNGPTTVFQRRIDAGTIWEPESDIKSGITRVFIFDWSDHPLKDQEWFDKREAKAREEGLMHIFNQEVLRDATAAVEGILIPGAWVNSIVDSHLKLGVEVTGTTTGAFDVADGGKDKQGLAIRKGILQKITKIWESPDVGVAVMLTVGALLGGGAAAYSYTPISGAAPT